MAAVRNRLQITTARLVAQAVSAGKIQKVLGLHHVLIQLVARLLGVSMSLLGAEALSQMWTTTPRP